MQVLVRLAGSGCWFLVLALSFVRYRSWVFRLVQGAGFGFGFVFVRVQVLVRLVGSGCWFLVLARSLVGCRS